MGAIDFGIIVDSAVVVIENCCDMLEQNRERIQNLPGAIVEAVSQMGRPILFSKAILLTAFIPLYTMQRVEGKIFRPMALTLTFALIVGTILALTVVPALASFAFQSKIRQSTNPGSCIGWPAIYRPALERALRSRVLVSRRCGGLLLMAGLVLTRMGTEFLPKLDEGSLVGARLHAGNHRAHRSRAHRHNTSAKSWFPSLK